MGRHKRSGRGLDAKFDQNFAPDLFRGVPVSYLILFDHLLNLKSQNINFLKNSSPEIPQKMLFLKIGFPENQKKKNMHFLKHNFPENCF